MPLKQTELNVLEKLTKKTLTRPTASGPVGSVIFELKKIIPVFLSIRFLNLSTLLASLTESGKLFQVQITLFAKKYFLRL